jgi:hypothetical protein
MPTPRRLLWLLTGAALLVAVAAGAVAFGSRPAAPTQPIRFDHAAHAKQAKCAACHPYATKLAATGSPKLADCLDCHEGTQSKTPEGKKEEEKIDIYAKAKKEIPWARIASLAPHTFFSHRRHAVVAKIDCATCHGPIAQTTALPSTPAIPFTMSFCVDCHARQKASVDCLACHR